MSRRAAEVRAGQSARAKDLTIESLIADKGLDAWAKKLQAQADQFIANKQPDPLDQYIY